MKISSAKIILILLITVFSFANYCNAELSKDKRNEIEKMLRLTGMEKLMGQMKSQMIAGLKPGMTGLSDEFWKNFEEKMDVRELVEKIIPLYDKYYTLEDLKAVNAFYESPAGQKVMSTLPQLMQESIKIGQEWGAKIGQQAEAEARKKSKAK